MAADSSNRAGILEGRADGITSSGAVLASARLAAPPASREARIPDRAPLG